MQIILKMTTACNLNCVYCSEGNQPAKTLPEEIFFKLVDELPPLLEHIGSKDAEFLFHGGEPMLYGCDKLKTLIDYARENLRGFNVEFLMQTNGTLIDDEWIKFFKAEKISPGVSLDGYPELHDKNRRTKSDEPTAEKVLQNLKLMREAGLSVGTLMVFNSPEAVDADNVKNSAEVYESWVELMKNFLRSHLPAPIHECSFNGSCGKNFLCVYPDGEPMLYGRDKLQTLIDDEWIKFFKAEGISPGVSLDDYRRRR